MPDKYHSNSRCNYCCAGVLQTYPSRPYNPAKLRINLIDYQVKSGELQLDIQLWCFSQQLHYIPEKEYERRPMPEGVFHHFVLYMQCSVFCTILPGCHLSTRKHPYDFRVDDLSPKHLKHNIKLPFYPNWKIVWAIQNFRLRLFLQGH